MANSTVYTLTIPSNGTVGVPLDIVATPGEGGPAAKTTVTFSDGGAGGTFTPATVEFDANDATAKTATYTPVAESAGKEVSVTATNDGSLTNPAAFTVNVAKLPFSTVTAEDPAAIDYGNSVELTFTPGDGVAHSADLKITLKSDVGVLDSNGELTIPKGTTAPVSIRFTPDQAGTATITATYPEGVMGPETLKVTTDAVAPSLPTVTLSTEADGVHVVIGAPASSGGSPIEEYRVYGGTSPGKANQTLLVTLKEAGEIVIKNVPFESTEYVNVEVANAVASVSVPEQSIVMATPASNTPPELVDVATLVNAYAKAAQDTDDLATITAHYNLVRHVLDHQMDDVVDFVWNYFSGKSGIYLPSNGYIGITLIPALQAVLVKDFEAYMEYFRKTATVPYDPNRFTRQGINAYAMLDRLLYITNSPYGRNE